MKNKYKSYLVSTCLSAFLVLSSTSIFAQFVSYDWVHNYAGSAQIGINKGTAIALDYAGNGYAVGLFICNNITFGSTVLTKTAGSSGTDIFIVKFDASSNLIWAQKAGGADFDCVNDVITDPSGNVYIVGSFTSPTISFGGITLTNADNTGTTDDIYLAKYDGLGNPVWAKSIGGAEYDYGNSVSCDAAGNIYITGSFMSSSVSVDGITLTNYTNLGSSDIIIAKFDSNGSAIWAEKAGGMGDDGGYGIATDAAGNSYITGQFGNSVTLGATVLSGAGYRNVFTAKYDGSGTVLWAKGSNGSGYDKGKSIAVDSAGNCYIGGEFTSDQFEIGTDTAYNESAVTSVWTEDIFIAKYTSSGHFEWADFPHASYDPDKLSKIRVDNLGNSYIAGEFHSAGIAFGATEFSNTSSCGDLSEIYIAKYDSSGNAVGAVSAQGWCSDYCGGLALGSNGSLFITGGFDSSPLTFGDTALLNSDGHFDVYFGKVTELKNNIGIPQILHPTTMSIYCDSIHPVVQVKNFGYDTISSFAVHYSVDGNTPTVYNWTGSLSSGASIDISLPLMTVLGGTHTFKAYTVNPNGIPDEYFGNDTSSVPFNIVVSASLPLTEGFEGGPLPPAGWILNDGSNLTMLNTVGGFGNSNASFLSSFYYFPSEIAYLISPSIDLSSAPTPLTMSFDVAYAQYDSTTHDSLIVYVSTDCGVIYTPIYLNGGATMATAPASLTAFSPNSAQWRTEFVSLNQYIGNANVLIMFVFKSDYGNNLFLDDINIDNTITGFYSSADQYSISVFPNPSAGEIEISSNNPIDELTITNILGQVIYQTKSKENKVVYRLEETGIYFVKVTSGNRSSTKKMMVNR